jgi:hypothetical protein
MNFKKFSFSLFLILLFLVVGCAAPKIKKIPLEKAEKDQFILVDDFDDGKDPNKFGGGQLIEVEPGALCSSTYTKEGAFSGYSVKINYQLARGTKSVWSMDLNDLDASAAQKIIFSLKHKKAVPLGVGLEDGFGNLIVVSLIPDSLKDKEWVTVQLELDKFRGVDLNDLKYFKLLFESRKEPIKSTTYVDEVKFFGLPNLRFLSLKDNLFGFPKDVLNKRRLKRISKLKDQTMLKEIARDVWKYFEKTVDKRSHLVIDYIQIAPDPYIGDYTSPTNIGLYLVSVISAYDLGFISEEEAISRLRNTLDTLKQLPKYKGFLYNFYNTSNLHITRNYISSVDSGWLAAALIVVRQSFGGELYQEATQLLEEMDFSFFYDENLGQLKLGYEVDKKKFTPYHYGFIASEARIASFIGIGMGDLPKEHWFKIRRTPPPEWDWPTQKPKGKYRNYLGQSVFEGYYTYEDLKVVPSWGGSMFEFLMPVLFIDEISLAPEGLGLNDILATKAQIKLAKAKDYPVWGFSPSSNPRGGYTEYGVKQIGITGYKEQGVATPHAAFLALMTLEKEAVANIKRMINDYEIYGEYGPYDSFGIRSGRISQKYLALDEGMILIALNNYLNDGVIQERFQADAIAKKAQDLLKIEKFPWAGEYIE